MCQGIIHKVKFQTIVCKFQAWVIFVDEPSNQGSWSLLKLRRLKWPASVLHSSLICLPWHITLNDLLALVWKHQFILFSAILIPCYLLHYTFCFGDQTNGRFSTNWRNINTVYNRCVIYSSNPATQHKEKLWYDYFYLASVRLVQWRLCMCTHNDDFKSRSYKLLPFFILFCSFVDKTFERVIKSLSSIDLDGNY